MYVLGRCGCVWMWLAMLQPTRGVWRRGQDRGEAPRVGSAPMPLSSHHCSPPEGRDATAVGLAEAAAGAGLEAAEAGSWVAPGAAREAAVAAAVGNALLIPCLWCWEKSVSSSSSPLSSELAPTALRVADNVVGSVSDPLLPFCGLGRRPLITKRCVVSLPSTLPLVIANGAAAAACA